MFHTQFKERTATTHNRKALFFSGGVDSLYSFFHHKEITHLLSVRGFDVKDSDTHLWQQSKEKIDEFARRHEIAALYIRTNLREITEQYVHRNYMFGAAMASI
ncbi:MAG: hypothetical protein H6765_00140 [Candidatus Peribacteria bacterium]|nr:MAG: hypothetical protein H6765_00140 [Candidatus Peribacteria bacterium]